LRCAGDIVQFLRQNRERLDTDLDRDPGMGFEVEVPTGVGGRSAFGRPDSESVIGLRAAGHRRYPLSPGPGADVVDEDHRQAFEELGIDTPLVRPELLDDLGVEVTGLAGSRVAMISLAVRDEVV
jgi:hypothetical protein